ncbi:hypothetical protein Bca101_101100 [Brassica carinata]
MAAHNMHPEEYDEDYEEEQAIEQRAILDEEDILLHQSSSKNKSPSIDRNGFMTSFPARPLRSSLCVEIIRRVAANGILYGCRRKTTSCHLTLEYWQRDKFWKLVSGCWILCLEMLENSALGLGQDLGLLLVSEGAMTNSTYISRFSFIMIPYRFEFRDRFLAYTTCMVGTEHLSNENF